MQARLDIPLSKIYSIKNVKIQPLTYRFWGHNNNLTAYKIIGVTYKYNESEDVEKLSDVSDTDNLEIVVSNPNPLCKSQNKVNEAIHIQNLIFERKIKSPFIHMPLYYDRGGMVISQYTSEGDLLQFIQTNFRRLSFNELRDIFAQLLLAVDVCHSNNLAHGDIKVDNVLVFLANGKTCIKLADLDEMEEVNEEGYSLNPRNRESGTEKYWPIELKKALEQFKIISNTDERRKILKFINKKAVDCYCLGVTLHGMADDLLLLEAYVAVKATTDLTQLTKEAYLKELYLGLSEPDVTLRWTITRAKESTLFGDTPALRASYFEQILKSAVDPLTIDGNQFNPPEDIYENAFFLLDRHIKDVYMQAKAINDDIPNLEKALITPIKDYEAVVQINNLYQAFLSSVKKFDHFSTVVKKTTQHQGFFSHLEDYEHTLGYIYNNLINMLDNKFTQFILIAIGKAQHDYEKFIAQSTLTYVLTHVCGFFSATSDTSLINKLKSKICNTTPNIETIKALKEILSGNAGHQYPINSFKHYLSLSIAAVLPKSLDEIENDMNNALTVKKRNLSVS